MTTPIFSDEVQLAGWSESHTSGAKVTFWLSDPAQLSAFRGMTERRGKTAGQRLAMVLVEINDDETLADEPPSTTKLGPLCALAVAWCSDAPFLAWWQRQRGHMAGDVDVRGDILATCGIKSRRELDADARAAAVFNDVFRLPYMAHCREAAMVEYGFDKLSAKQSRF